MLPQKHLDKNTKIYVCSRNLEEVQGRKIREFVEILKSNNINILDLKIDSDIQNKSS